MADETAWLVERALSGGPELAYPPQYLMVDGNVGTGAGRFGWTGGHQWALRFSRRADAILFIGAMRTLSDALPYAATIAGLRSGDPTPKVVEHMWADAPSNSAPRYGPESEGDTNSPVWGGGCGVDDD